MDAKYLIFVLSIVNYVQCGGLLRTPKVYNAVITTDENLTPSRAYPVIQPTIHATYPFGPFNGFRYYNPSILPFQQPTFRQNLFPEPSNAPPSQPPPPMGAPPEFGPMHPMKGMPFPPPQQMPDMPPPEPTPQDPSIMPEERPPIPLNELGLPPSLVPLHNYQRPQRPFNLQPYPYNHYPLIYDSFHQYQDQYLPPFGYYPPHTFAIRPPSKKTKNPSGKPTEDENSPNIQENQEKPGPPNFDNIKNGSVDKNSPVPDVPPPPLPSGAKVVDNE